MTEAQSEIAPDGFSAQQYRAFLLSFFVIFFDGFDTQVISYVAPVIAKQWRLAPGAMGSVFSAGLFGLMLGALFLSPLADRIGRRWVIIPATFAFAICSVATVAAHSLVMLGGIRFLTGLALGPALTNSISLTSDFSPPRRRGAVTMIVTSGVSLGSIASGLLAARLTPAFGWQAVFVVGGLMPVLLASVMIFLLPESIRRPGASDRAAEQRSTVGALFAPGLGRITPLIWIGFGATLLAIYLIVNWLPTILTSVGFSPAAAAATTTFYHWGAVVGTFVLAMLVDRVRPRSAVLIANAICILSLLLYSLAMHGAGGWTPLYLFGIGFGTVGGQIALIALCAVAYPTFLRGTGLGWGLGIGRIGSIAGPLLGGAMIARGISPEAMLRVCMASIAVVAVAISLTRGAD